MLCDHWDSLSYILWSIIVHLPSIIGAIFSILPRLFGVTRCSGWCYEMRYSLSNWNQYGVHAIWLLISTLNLAVKPIQNNWKIYTNSENNDSVGALEKFSAIFTLPQINLDVLHPSGDYMESWPVINFLCGDADRAQANLNERIKKKKKKWHQVPTPPHHNPTLPPPPWAPFLTPLTLYPRYQHTLAPCLAVFRSLSHTLSALTRLALSLSYPLFSPWVSR